MRKIIALVCTLALILLAVPAAAEDDVPQQVQAFFDALNKEMGTSYEAASTTDLLTYAEAMPVGMTSFTLSRMQYNSYYYFILGRDTAVTVCCVDGVPAAYIMDFSAVNFIGGDDATHALLQALPTAYFQANPECKDTFEGYDLVTQKLLDYAYSEMKFGSDMLTYSETIVSSHIFSLGYRATLQLFPRAAYDGLTFEEKALTAEENHNLSAALALTAEYQMVMKSIE